ncbi:Sensor histidine kinase [Sandaracinus amylolyticus]|uniref:histidine kinase n=1 Tax=Sandaracinus amylolyticus TaxID=927083 RepID=A0A0F6YMK2_9BACT|nr:Sensor histidine kinase [Sandaracinus amylolyticus]
MLVASIALVTFAAVAAAQWVESQASLRRERATAEAVRIVERRMDAYVALLRGVAALFAYDERVDGEGFARFVEHLQVREYPGIQGLGWSERVEPEQDGAVLARIDGAASGLWPERPHDRERHAIVFLEPRDVRNRAAIGFDMHSEATRREAMDRARDEGVPAATGAVTLVQEIDGDVQPGFLIYVPVYEGGDVPRTLEERRARLRGFAYAPFRAGDLFRAMFPDGFGAHLTIHDGTEAHAARELFEIEASGHTASPSVQRMEIAGRPWTLVVRPRGDRVSDARVVGIVIALVGALLTALAFRSAWAEARARERAEEALAIEARHAQFRETFLGVLGHDLRNPLSAVRMTAQALQRAPSIDETSRRALERIVRSADRAIRMVSQLLDVTRARLGGGLPIEARTVALAPLLREVVDELCSTHDARFELDVDDRLALHADPDRIAQVLSNLAGNALTHGEPPLRLSAHAEGRMARVEVANGGAPIPPHVLATLFDPFVRGAQRGGNREGLGLGLYISQQIAIAHGGSLDASSDAERGTRFVVRLPLAG